MLQERRAICFLLLLFAGADAAADSLQEGRTLGRRFAGYDHRMPAPLLTSTRRRTNSIHYRDVSDCRIYCNSELSTATECIGRMEILCLTYSEETVEGGLPFAVEAYSRVCDGHFVNETIGRSSKQACRGLTTMTMRQEHRESAEEDFHTDFSYEETCSTRFAMDVLEAEDGEGGTMAVTLCEGASRTETSNVAWDEPPETQPYAAVDESPSRRREVQCNGERSSWTSPCEGRFDAVETQTDLQTETFCEGRWIPYGISSECIGEYNYTRVEETSGGFSILERGCTGSSIVSSAILGIVYDLCNGEARFNEQYTYPLFA